MDNAHPAPTFSVVIALFNKESYIAETITSVLNQTMPEFEIIVIDDGSTDSSVAVVRGFSDARLRLIHQGNCGPGLARNRGVAAARGKWVAFIDADDLWLSDHLSTLAATISALPAAGIVASGYTRGNSLNAAASPGCQQEYPGYINFFDEHSKICSSAIAVRTTILRQNEFGAIWPGEDVELWTRLALRHDFAVHPRCTAVYVQHTGGAMDSQAAAGTPIERQPLFATINAALADDALAGRHAAIWRFRNALMLEYTRPSLFNGEVALARSYLANLRRNSGRAPLLYRVLSHFPGPFLRRVSHLYSTAKRRWR